MHELVYTSAPKGLKPGSQGFCTVACSAGMPPNLMMRLETLSAYRSLSTLGSYGSQASPVARSHLVLRVGGTDWHVLSRIGDAGIDYTQRSNKIAHHIVLEPSELPLVGPGPAALLRCDERFFNTWDGEPKVITKPAQFPAVKSQPQICTQWERETGDPGWGGVLAQTARDNQPVIIVAEPKTNMLALFEESLALLPPEIRWRTTLTTYYTRFPNGVACRWRCVMSGTFETMQAAVAPDTLIIDLTRPLKTPVPGPLVKAARSGKAPGAFLDVGNIVGLSSAIDVERRQEQSLADQTSGHSGTSNDYDDCARDDGTESDTVETVSNGKKRKAKSNRNAKSSDKFFESREQWLESTKQNDKHGLLALLGLGFVFFVVPILLFGLLFSVRGCHDTAQRKQSNSTASNATTSNDTVSNGSTKNEPDNSKGIAAKGNNGDKQQAHQSHVPEVAVSEKPIDRDDKTIDGNAVENTVDDKTASQVLSGRKLHVVLQRHDSQSLLEAKVVSGTDIGGFDGDVPEQLFDLGDVKAKQLLMTLRTAELHADGPLFIVPKHANKQESSKHVEVRLNTEPMQSDGPSFCIVAFELVPNCRGIVIEKLEYKLFDETIKTLNNLTLYQSQLRQGAANRLSLNDISLPSSNSLDEKAKLAWLDEYADNVTLLENLAAIKTDNAVLRQQLSQLVALLRCHGEYFGWQSQNSVPSLRSISTSFDYDIYEKRPGNGTEIVPVVTSKSDEKDQ